jgi:hypothetical protein
MRSASVNRRQSLSSNDKIAGNGPIIVNKYDGTVLFLGGSVAQRELLAE